MKETNIENKMSSYLETMFTYTVHFALNVFKRIAITVFGR